MSAPSLEVLVADVRSRINDPARRELAAVVVTDLAQLHARLLAGEQVDAEIAHARSQATGLVATELREVANAFVSWAGQVAGAVVHGVIAAA